MTIKKLKDIKCLDELKEFIKNIYKQDYKDLYIPAIINSGNFTVENGEDFYLKLVLAHQKMEISKTWLKSNMVFGIKDPDFERVDSFYEVLTENVITHRKVKGNTLYQLNPNIVGDEIVEYEYDNNTFVNAYYNEEYSNIKGKPVLIQKNDKDVYVYKNVFKNYLNEIDSNIYPKYRLVAEFEYRTHNNIFDSIESKVYKFEDSIFDVSCFNGQMQIIGSVNIGILSTVENKSEIRNIKVISLDDRKIRKHNPNNYDDDTNAGFVLFHKDVLKIIKKNYYIYDLTMYDKTNIENKYLIDILQDKVVFWEGEYNKLPNSFKDEIDKFNFGSDNESGIISPGMMAWQLEVDWNFHLKLYPEQQLAFIVKSKFFNAAIENGISFFIPDNINDFKDFILRIENITGTHLERFNQSHNDVKNLVKIRDNKMEELNIKEIELLFRKYCFQLSRVIDNEFFK